jgi:hypothetical protein
MIQFTDNNEDTHFTAPITGLYKFIDHNSYTVQGLFQEGQTLEFENGSWTCPKTGEYLLKVNNGSMYHSIRI